MSTINVQCVDQTLTFTNMPVIASGGVNEDNIQFTFCSQWNGFARVCVFWQQPGNLYFALIGTDNSCVIPSEVMEKSGRVFFAVVGVNTAGDRRTSEVVRYQISEGVVTDPGEPTPSIYNQILSYVATATQALQGVTTLSTSVQNAIATQNATIANLSVAQFELRTAALEDAVGDLDDLTTSVKTDLVAAINDLQTALSGKAASSHTHSISDITGLQTALDGITGQLSGVSDSLDSLNGEVV